MVEEEIANGRFNILYDSFAGYQAPDEDEWVKRPVRKDQSEHTLYDRRNKQWQQVQVEIPNGLCTIGYGAFEDCRGLTKVVIPNTVDEIGERAFCGCAALTDVIMPDGLMRVKKEAFRGCTALSKITIPDYTDIGDRAFQDCSGLTHIRIPDTVEKIGASAFAGCNQLQEITLPESLSMEAKRIFGDIGPLAWKWLCRKVKVNPALEVPLRAELKKRRKDIAHDVITEEDEALLDRFLALWEKVPLDLLDELLETAANAEKTALKAMLMQYKNQMYTQKSIEAAQRCKEERMLGVRSSTVAEWHRTFVFRNDEPEIVIRGYKKREPLVIVPAVIGNKPVVAIAQWAVKGIEYQAPPYTVILPEGLREIRSNAFEDSNIKHIKIPKTVTKIGAYAFANCEYLENVSIPFGVEWINAGICCNCGSLRSVTIPESVTGIDIHAFDYCNNLSRLVLPANVSEIFVYYRESDFRISVPRGSVTEKTIRKTGLQYDTY